MSTVDTTGIVFQEWMFKLPMQQQSVLVLACRGPDGIAKFHPCKELVARYRASVLKAAYIGRAMRPDEFDTTTFMTLRDFTDGPSWKRVVKAFFETVDELPHHYYMHVMHGAQIIGYKHPEDLFRTRWMGFYYRCCADLHLNPETEAEMDARLADWNQQFWDSKQKVDHDA